MARKHDREDTHIFRYVLMHDSGMAPNPRGGLISLATCKPRIRESARVGDWVIGNYPAPHNQLVAWAGKINAILDVGDYPVDYPERDDALYLPDAMGELRRIRDNEGNIKHEWYHPGEHEQRKDKRGMVLLFDRQSSWYFGDDGRPMPVELEHLIKRGIGESYTHRKPGDLERLIEWLHEQGPPGIHGEPRDGWAGPDEPGCTPSGTGSKQRPPQRRITCGSRRLAHAQPLPQMREPARRTRRRNDARRIRPLVRLDQVTARHGSLRHALIVTALGGGTVADAKERWSRIKPLSASQRMDIRWLVEEGYISLY